MFKSKNLNLSQRLVYKRNYTNHMNKIVWFRYDLRLTDNEAFLNATKNGNILPIFIFDEGYFKLEVSSSFHLKFIIESIDELDSKLQKQFGANLNTYYGNTLEILKRKMRAYDFLPDHRDSAIK